MPLPPFWSLAPKITRLLLAVLPLLSFLSGGMVHAQSVIDVAVFYTTAAKNAQSWTTKEDAETAIQNWLYRPTWPTRTAG